MLLFVGLGNPTPDSENNRHNVGFKIIDTINKKFSLSKQKPKFKGLLTTGNIANKKVYAIKPLTFMNLSLIHISEPTRLRRISYAVFCLKKKKHNFRKVALEQTR